MAVCVNLAGRPEWLLIDSWIRCLIWLDRIKKWIMVEEWMEIKTRIRSVGLNRFVGNSL